MGKALVLVNMTDALVAARRTEWGGREDCTKKRATPPASSNGACDCRPCVSLSWPLNSRHSPTALSAVVSCKSAKGDAVWAGRGSPES